MTVMLIRRGSSEVLTLKDVSSLDVVKSSGVFQVDIYFKDQPSRTFELEDYAVTTSED